MNRFLGKVFDKLANVTLKPPMWLRKLLLNIANYFWGRAEKKDEANRIKPGDICDLEEYTFDSKLEVVKVVERLRIQIVKQGWVSVAEYYIMIGEPSSFEDTKWGWDDLNGLSFRRWPSHYQAVESWLLDLPAPKRIKEKV